LELTGKKIIIIVENLPLPFDRRVWQEANTLKKYGANIFIICPKGLGAEKKYERINGIHIYRHSLPLEAKNAMGYFFEYSFALFCQWKLLNYIWKKENGFDIIQACNPPDIIYLVIKKYIKKGVKFVFDHHDINPELYLSKFNKKDIYYKLLLYFEFQTFNNAHVVISTNESYKKIALDRGKVDKNKVFIIRSGPDLSRLVISNQNINLKKGKNITIGYVGVIGKQEGIDHLLEALNHLMHSCNYNDFHCYICGSGPALSDMKNYMNKLELDKYVTFTSRIPDKELLEILNTSDICVNPDSWNEMNDKSTMNKIMEYMALGKPIVQYDLKEGRYSAGESSLYAEPNNPLDFAKNIYSLIINPKLRAKMGNIGHKRVHDELQWDIEALKYASIYKNILYK